MVHRSFDNDASWETLRSQWSLRPGVNYLNHGSFGPSPRPVLAARREWIERLESEPMDFFVRGLEGHLSAARQRLGSFLNTSGDNLVFVDNATVAMNVVAASVRLSAGDEVLANDHEYGAVLRIWERACARAGARLVIRELPSPLSDADEVVECLLAGGTDRTRLVVFSHVTSSTAITLPAEAICRRARQMGLAVCIDGPHALAMTAVDLERLDCDYYAASCHKWLCAPFGCGFLYVHPRAQATVEPIVTSWGRLPRLGPPDQPATWRDEFEWAGTRDYSAFLAVTAAIDFLESVGLDAFRQRTHYLAQLARERITSLTGIQPLVPDSPHWYGSMISLPLPPVDGPALQQALWEQHQIEVPIFEWRGQHLLRPSCHLYTQPAEIEKLADALGKLWKQMPC